MNTVKTPLTALIATLMFSSLVAGCSAINQEGDGAGPGAMDQSYSAPPAKPSEDKES